MSDVVSFAARKGDRPRMRIGLLRLTDSAPVVVAHEFGFFADEDIEAELMVEPSWANIADKLAYGFLDAAVIVPPLAFAVQLGLRGTAQPLIIPYAISAGGNTVTLSRSLAQETHERANREGVSIVEALAACLRDRRVTLGVVHAYSTHNLLLRYWLATAGIEAGRDFKLAVSSPRRARWRRWSRGRLPGSVRAAPGDVAHRAGIGATVATSHDIWRNAPEKALAVRARWAGKNSPRRSRARSVRCCAPRNSAAIRRMGLTPPPSFHGDRILDVDPHAILASLPGAAAPDKVCIFFRGAATFPWRSHGLWFLNEMRRWGLVDESIDLRALAERVYRPDLYRIAIADLGEPAPLADWKHEGAHDASWAVGRRRRRHRHARRSPLRRSRF